MKTIFNNSGFLNPKLRVEFPLYRYRSNIDYIVDEIKNEHIFLSDLDSLNDPFDSSYAYSYDEALEKEISFEELWKTSLFLSHYDWYKPEEFTDIDKTRKMTLKNYSLYIENTAKKHGDICLASTISKSYWRFSSLNVPKRNLKGRVACFSEKWDSIPMWSYYADSHKGCCFKYDLDLLDSNDIVQNNIRNSIHKIWYSNKRFKDIQGAFSPFMKDESWSHEQEWRIFQECGQEYLTFPCLSEIYLGLNFDLGKIGRIKEAIKYTSRPITVFILRPPQEEYGFIKTPLLL